MSRSNRFSRMTRLNYNQIENGKWYIIFGAGYRPNIKNRVYKLDYKNKHFIKTITPYNQKEILEIRNTDVNIFKEAEDIDEIEEKEDMFEDNDYVDQEEENILFGYRTYRDPFNEPDLTESEKRELYKKFIKLENPSNTKKLNIHEMTQIFTRAKTSMNQRKNKSPKQKVSTKHRVKTHKFTKKGGRKKNRKTLKRKE
jgi:hypothetical protein